MAKIKVEVADGIFDDMNEEEIKSLQEFFDEMQGIAAGLGDNPTKESFFEALEAIGVESISEVDMEDEDKSALMVKKTVH